MQTPGLILNPTIWSRSQHPQPRWWSHLAPTTASMLSLHCIFGGVTEGRGGKVMAKPLANRVIVGRKHAHAQTHTYTFPKCINLLASAARYSSIDTFCQGYSERHYHASLVWECVLKIWQWYRKDGFKAVIIHRIQDRKRLTWRQIWKYFGEFSC